MAYTDEDRQVPVLRSTAELAGPRDGCQALSKRRTLAAASTGLWVAQRPVVRAVTVIEGDSFAVERLRRCRHAIVDSSIAWDCCCRQ